MENPKTTHDDYASEYDLVCALTSFRRCAVYLPIIAELSKKFKIALYQSDIDEIYSHKTEDTNELFVELCKDIGAEIISLKNNVKTKILLMPQWHFSETDIQKIRSFIQCTKVFWVVALATGNHNFEFLHGLPIDKILVVDKKLYNFRLSFREQERNFLIDPQIIIQTGLPFKKYPFFKDFEIDYLWANPTPFSFPNLEDRLYYLDQVRKLISKIDSDQRILFKPHNAQEKEDYIVNSRVLRMLNLVNSYNLLSALNWMARQFSKCIPINQIKEFFLHIAIAAQYKLLMKRVIPLRNITKYHNFNLELFLPSVKKGMITGRSNSLWHALFFKIPVYNCAPDEININANQGKKQSSYTMHSHNMEYFGVKHCYGDLEFDAKLFSTIDEDVRNADLIQFLIHEVEGTVNC